MRHVWNQLILSVNCTAAKNAPKDRGSRCPCVLPEELAGTEPDAVCGSVQGALRTVCGGRRRGHEREGRGEPTAAWPQAQPQAASQGADAKQDIGGCNFPGARAAPAGPGLSCYDAGRPAAPGSGGDSAGPAAPGCGRGCMQMCTGPQGLSRFNSCEQLCIRPSCSKNRED